ncbi:GNAT family N-acetyltransferase [Saccharopolyspora gloriosae]|uniref:GNAT family N-acetyltransferase n=1 Tax=Saccharopolyspora gloriosae TaxID=455344 RepID=UPI001FB78D01|nr:GNAT family N-acetyltransferase [Saccharopolyspora gloriosae]
MEPHERLQYDGVDLRRWRLEDAGVALRVVTESLDHLGPWMPWAKPGYGMKEAADFVGKNDREWTHRTAFNYAVLGPQQQVIGAAGLMDRIGPGGFEIGYWLHGDFEGRGIMRRAVTALIEEAFRLGADRVEIWHDEANVRSGAIPKALGFIEVDRRPAREYPVAPACTGTFVVWRLTAPELLDRPK